MREPIPHNHGRTLGRFPEALKGLQQSRVGRHTKGTNGTFVLLGWHITLGLSVLSLLFNFAYFYVALGNTLHALTYSASSLLTIGAAHGANSFKDQYNK